MEGRSSFGPFRRLVCALAALAVLLFSAPRAAADSGDYDRIEDYTVTVDLREDGSADITYDIDWQVIGGGKGDALSWVKVGLANPHADGWEALTPDTIAGLSLLTETGSYMRVDLARQYYAPAVAEELGEESRVHFAFRVHQERLYTLEEDGAASYVFTPGWFDDLNVQRLTVRWRAQDGLLADNTGEADGYLTWVFGPLAHGQAGTVRVTVPAAAAAAFSSLPQEDGPAGAPGYPEEDEDPVALLIGIMAVCLLLLVLAAILIHRHRAPRWHGGFGGLDADDWLWYSNGSHVIHLAPDAPPPAGYRPAKPPASFRAGGGSFRGGGAGRRSGGSSSSCACACVSSCACACACAGGGRAGCSAKNFYRVGLPAPKEDTP